MNTVEATKLFEREFTKQTHPKCEIVTTDTSVEAIPDLKARAHDVRQFSAEIAGMVPDDQLAAWIKEVAVEAARFECHVVDILLESERVRVKLERERDQKSTAKPAELKDIRLVRRAPIGIVRTKNETGDPCWRISGRVGTRIEPEKNDPRSALAQAIATAEREEQNKEEAVKPRSQVLRDLP